MCLAPRSLFKAPTAIVEELTDVRPNDDYETSRPESKKEETGSAVSNEGTLDRNDECPRRLPTRLPTRMLTGCDVFGRNPTRGTASIGEEIRK